MKILEVKYPKNLPSEIVVSFTALEAVAFVNGVKMVTDMNEAYYFVQVAKRLDRILDGSEVV